MRDIVLTSEILTLPDMTGYFVAPGDYPIAKVDYDYVPTEKIAEGFVERNGLGIAFKDMLNDSTEQGITNLASDKRTASFADAL